MAALTNTTGVDASMIRERYPSVSMPSQVPDVLSQTENLGKSTPREPRFMSPTVSSTKQTTVKASKHGNSTTIPSASSSKHSGSGNWMSSAAKRVGLGRTGDGHPRSKKEGRSKQPMKAVSFPDKLASTSYSGGLPDSPASSKGSKVSKASLDKPLPSPPIAQVLSASPPKMNRSLIDASEQPLRRSPPGKPFEQEEWPVLFPDRPTTPGTLNAMTEDQNGALATNPPQIKERYPLLPSSSYGPSPNFEHKGAEKSSSSSRIQRKQVSSQSLRKDTKDQKTSHTNKENASPRRDIPNTAHRLSNDRRSGSPSKIPGLTAGAAAVEKASYESKANILEPRQTRTSSLRARLSAGQVIKDSPTGPNKVLGFTDFTTSKDLPTDRLVPPPKPVLAPVKTTGLSKKGSRDSIRGKRPAQIVAGSRRVPSRGSLRNDSRASSHASSLPPPSRTAPTVPDVSGKESYGRNSSLGINASEAAARKSSLPTFRQAVSTIVTQADGKLAPSENKGSKTHPPQIKLDPTTFGIFEDTNKDHETLALGAIEESPRNGYHIKRLSVNSPEHGPTLKISPSADRLIMGTGSDKENDSGHMKNRSRGASRVLGAKDLYSSSKIKAPLRREIHARPSSSQGLPLSASRPKLDAEAREKKVRSADVGASVGIDHLMRLSGKERHDSSRNTGTSTNDDPFFDAHSTLDNRISRASNGEQRLSALNGLLTLDNASWVEPVHKHLNATANIDASLVPADVLSVITHEDDTPLLAATVEDTFLLTVKPDASDKAEDLPGFELTPPKTAEPVPMTPEVAHAGKASSNTSGSLPPRSSSRQAHPDFTGKKSSPVSPFGNKEAVPIDFTDRQNRLGSLGGLGTSQIDFAVPTSNRTSLAQESQKSQGSVSKGVLSKFGGLFHKRHSEEQHAAVKSTKKPKEKKVSITSNGSPFPPISEVHPIHRPTLSSSRRAKDNAPRSPLPDFSTHGIASPALNSPMPTEVSTTTTLAMEILDSARKERSSPKKEKLLEMGKIMVEALTQARDAERAMEEAKQAARKAEVAHALCKKSIGDIEKMVIEWKSQMARGSH